MKVTVGILLILLFVVMVVLLSIVSYLLWDEACEVREKHRRTRIATQRLEEKIERMNHEPQIDWNETLPCHKCESALSSECTACDGQRYFRTEECNTDCGWR